MAMKPSLLPPYSIASNEALRAKKRKTLWLETKRNHAHEWLSQPQEAAKFFCTETPERE